MTVRTAVLLLSPALLPACAGLPGPRPLAVLRGTIATDEPAVRPIVAGPVTLRAYSGFGRARIFLADDCGAPAPPVARAVVAERRLTLEVPAGRVACLATESRRSFELLWRAVPRAEPSPALAVRSGR